MWTLCATFCIHAKVWQIDGLKVNAALPSLYYLTCIEHMMWELPDFIPLALFTVLLWCKNIIALWKSHFDPLNANNRDHGWSGLMLTLSSLYTLLALGWCVHWMPTRDGDTMVLCIYVYMYSIGRLFFFQCVCSQRIESMEVKLYVSFWCIIWAAIWRVWLFYHLSIRFISIKSPFTHPNAIPIMFVWETIWWFWKNVHAAIHNNRGSQDPKRTKKKKLCQSSEITFTFERLCLWRLNVWEISFLTEPNEISELCLRGRLSSNYDLNFNLFLTQSYCLFSDNMKCEYVMLNTLIVLL